MIRIDLKICCLFLVCLFGGIDSAIAQQTVGFPLNQAAGEVEGDLYGSGTHGVVLAHGGRFNKESWRKQAEAIAAAGFRVLAVRFRGDAFNPDGSPSTEGSDADNADDVLAGIAYLRQTGAGTIAVVGASLGGDAAGLANSRLPGGVDRIVFLGSSGGEFPDRLGGRKLFIVARDDRNSEGPRLPRIRASYAQAREPKQLLVVAGSAHAQFLFDTVCRGQVCSMRS